MLNRTFVNKLKDERGAAMVMALMVTFLLLVASTGLLLESSINSQNVTDATAEQQAYNAAESGIQSAVNVLRGNVVPSPLLDASKPATDVANKIDFVKALRLTTSNLSGDTSTQPRLSRWMTYDGTCNDRIFMGLSACNQPNNVSYGGYSLTLSDPDNTGNIVTYTTTGNLQENDSVPGFPNTTQKTYGTGGNTIVVKYYPTSVSNLDVTGGAAATNYGYFKVTTTGTGASLPAFNRFSIVIRMTRPYTATRVIRGYIESNCTVTLPSHTLDCSSRAVPKIIFDAQSFTLMGSVTTLNFPWGSATPVYDPTPEPPAQQRVGYEAQLSGSAAGTDNNVVGTITSPEPTRILLTSTGYGPRGSEKRLQAIIRKDFFDGLRPPATLTLVGPRSTTNPGTTFTFNPGSSAVTVYSGDDTQSTDIIPPIGTTDDGNLDDVETSVARQPPHPFNGQVIGAPANITEENPDFLQSPVALDTLIQSMATVAQSSGRFYSEGTTPPDFGNLTTGMGITFCDGDVEMSGDGGGLLIVTGTLTLRGNFNFKGLIFVTGEGGVTRRGGGEGTIEGNMIVAPYVGSRVEDGINPAITDTFLAPQYDLSGGGNSTIRYNSSSSTTSLIAVSNFVLGVVEK